MEGRDYGGGDESQSFDILGVPGATDVEILQTRVTLGQSRREQKASFAPTALTARL